MIASVKYVSSLLEHENIKPNRNLGQNYFIDGEYLSQLISNVPLDGKHVLEIGPGLGALTELLLDRGASVTAIEKDPVLIPLLKQALPAATLTVIEADCLRIRNDLMPKPFTAAGNLPYYITADIIEKLYRMRPEQMILMIQKEAADRFFAQPSDKNYVPLSAACSLFYTVERLGNITPEKYYPSPNVTSTVIYLKERPDFPQEDPGEVLSFFSECFRMRRKTLVNNLSAYGNCKAIIESLGLSGSVRGEALSPEQLLALFRKIKPDNI